MTRPLTPEWLAGVLTAAPVRWPELAAVDPATFCQACEQHGITALVAERLEARAAGRGGDTDLRRRLPLGSLPDLPNRPGLEDQTDLIVSVLRESAFREAAADLVRERALKELCGGLAEAGVPPLLMKGAHVAYACYARPDLRPRVDTDLLIDPADRERAHRVLVALGYHEAPQSGGDLLMYQVSYELKGAGATTHVVDVHWRISNAQRFGKFLSHAEILREAIPLAGLGPALGPSPVHAVLLACVHRVAHHLDTPRLIWSYDLYLLGRMLSVAEWDRVAVLAGERGVAAACERSLSGAASLLGGGPPAGTMTALASAASREGSSVDYLDARRPHIHRVVADFRALDSWRDRWRLARQHVFPAPAYMRSVYAPSSRAPLAVLYLRRAWWGALRWLAQP